MRKLVPNKFTEITYGEWRDDHRYFVREFSGNMTVNRMRTLLKWCRDNTWEEHCNCPGDCCGHCFQQTANYTYIAGQVVVIIQRLYNY